MLSYLCDFNNIFSDSLSDLHYNYAIINQSCFIYIKYIFCIVLVLTEARSFCDILRTVARWCVWLHRLAQEHRSRGSACARHVLCVVDPRPVHATSGERHGLESDVSTQVSGPRRLLGWRVWEAVHKVRNTHLHLRTQKSLLMSFLFVSLLVSLSI